MCVYITLDLICDRCGIMLNVFDFEVIMCPGSNHSIHFERYWMDWD